MRRKSTRNSKTSTPDKVKTPKRTKRTKSTSSSEESDEEPLSSLTSKRDSTPTTPVQCDEETSTERKSKRLRNKPTIYYDKDSSPEEKYSRRSRRRGSPLRKNQTDDDYDNRSKGKSKGKSKSKLEQTAQVTESEISENAQVTAQSPGKDTVDNVEKNIDAELAEPNNAEKIEDIDRDESVTRKDITSDEILLPDDKIVDEKVTTDTAELVNNDDKNSNQGDCETSNQTIELKEKGVDVILDKSNEDENILKIAEDSAEAKSEDTKKDTAETPKEIASDPQSLNTISGENLKQEENDTKMEVDSVSSKNKDTNKVDELSKTIEKADNSNQETESKPEELAIKTTEIENKPVVLEITPSMIKNKPVVLEDTPPVTENTPPVTENKSVDLEITPSVTENEATVSVNTPQKVENITTALETSSKKEDKVVVSEITLPENESEPVLNTTQVEPEIVESKMEPAKVEIEPENNKEQHEDHQHSHESCPKATEENPTKIDEAQNLTVQNSIANTIELNNPTVDASEAENKTTTNLELESKVTESRNSRESRWGSKSNENDRIVTDKEKDLKEDKEKDSSEKEEQHRKKETINTLNKKSHEKDRSQSRDRTRSHDKDRSRSRDRTRNRNKGRSQNRSRSCDKDYSSKNRNRSSGKDSNSKDRNKSRDKESSQNRDRSRERESSHKHRRGRSPRSSDRNNEIVLNRRNHEESKKVGGESLQLEIRASPDKKDYNDCLDVTSNKNANIDSLKVVEAKENILESKDIEREEPKTKRIKLFRKTISSPEESVLEKSVSTDESTFAKTSNNVNEAEKTLNDEASKDDSIIKAKIVNKDDFVTERDSSDINSSLIVPKTQNKSSDLETPNKTFQFAKHHTESPICEEPMDVDDSFEQGQFNFSKVNVSIEETKSPSIIKWNKVQYLDLLIDLIDIDTHRIQEHFPDIKLLDESQVVLENPIKKVERRVTIEEKVLPSVPPKTNENLIALNRKISIVDDEASKLRPPPSPPKNERSELLFITNLVRPFTLKQLKELLSRTGNIRENGFWTDGIKSKCIVHYETSDEAEATRNALHGVQWPSGNGKKLMIDYTTPEELEKARNPPPPVPVVAKTNVIEKENEVPPEQEIISKNEVDDKPPNNHMKRETTRDKDVRNHDLKHKEKQEKRRRSRSRHSRSLTPDHKKRVKPAEESVPQRAMDDLFNKTKAVPCLYWQPLSPEEIALKQQQRLERMKEHKRRLESQSHNKRGRESSRGGAFRRRY